MCTYSQFESTTNHSATFNPVQHVCNPVHSQTLHIASLKQDRITAISNNTNLQVVTNVTQNIGHIAQHIPCHTCRHTHTHLHHNSHLTAVHYVSVHYSTHCYSRFIYSFWLYSHVAHFNHSLIMQRPVTTPRTTPR